MKIGEKETLTATVFPEGATDPTVIWESSDELIATVVDGAVTGKSEGTATITAKAGEQSATCTVIVNKIPVSSITINGAEPTLVEGDTLILTATITPSDASYKTVTWTSSNGTVATVDQNGKVTAKSVGTATIKATADGVTAECTITVEEKVIAVDSITLDPTTGTLLIGDTLTITATVTPDTATDKSITWTSDNEAVATVDSNGKVTAKSVGTATITATAGDKSATCTITVNPIKVTGVKILDPPTEVAYGESLKLRIEVSPGNATDKSVTWTSDKPSIATITNDGVVAIHNEGTVVFTVTTNDGGFTDSCTINIKKPTTVVPVSSVSLNKTTLTLDKGDSGTLTASVLPKDATNQAVTWSTSSDAVATVDSNGKITAVGKGEATITATSADNAAIKATCKVTVNVPVTGVSLDKDEETLSINETLQLKATVSPEDASNSNVTWKSSNELVATVSDSGLVTAKEKAGETTITVTTEDGAFSATCKINVVVPVTGVTLDKTTLDLKVGESIKLSATVKPADATNKNVNWTSNNENVATIDGEGNVKAVGEGTAVITVETVDGKKTATCTVTVKKAPVASITLDKTEAEMLEGEYLRLSATVQPWNANQTVTWTSNDDSIATVDENGMVSSIAGGTAIITATAEGKTATCTVTVLSKTSGALTYKFSSYVKTAYVEKCDNSKIGSDGIVVIPDEYAGYKITEIGYKAFENCTNLKSVTIGQNVGTINSDAFSGCTGLTSITIPGNVEIVYGNAFKGCSGLTSVTLEEGIRQIYDYAFWDCTGISKIDIPNTVTTIGLGAFFNCTSLSTVTIGSGVTSIEDNTFYKCPIINLDNKSSVTPKIAYTSDIYKKVGTPKILEIGSIYTSIESQAFMETSIEEITIPSKITSIGDYSFWKCKDLKKVTIREGIKSIGNSAFNSCSKLTEIVIPNSVTYFGADVFRYCSSLSNVTIGSGITSLYDYTFEDCPITSLTNYSSVTPKIEYINAIYVQDEDPTKPKIGEIYTSIGAGAFKGTGVKTVVIPANITSIGYQAFDSCDGLTEITIPGTVKSIGSEAFNNCKNLKKVTINSGVESIGITAFSGCPITDLTNDSGLSFNVAYTSAMYDESPNPANPEIKDFYTIIDNNAFQGREELQSITIPDNIEMIGGSAFEGCKNLSTVNFGPGSKLTRIGPNAFQNCTALTSITLPNSVTTIYAAAFSSSGLTSISIPDSVFQIDSQTFMGCTALSSVSIGTGVKTIGNYAFKGCTSLTSVEIPDNVTFIYDCGFDGCSGLTSVTIGEGITSIGQYAFRGCTSVTEYVFRGNTPPELRDKALSGLGEFDIFVPNEAVAAYEKAWPEYVGQIKTR